RWTDQPRGDDRCPPGLRPGWPASYGRSPSSPHGSDRDAAWRSAALGGRAGAAPPQPGDDGHLREGRPGRPASPGAALAGRCGMSGLHAAAEDYLALRHALGFKMERPAPLLRQFVAFLEQEAVSTVTVELAVAWAKQPGGNRRYWW